MASNSNMGGKSSPEDDQPGLNQAQFPGESEFLVKGKTPT